VFLWVAAAHALINPRFTPIHLVKQSALILWVDLKQGQSKDQYDAAIREVLKGKTGAIPLCVASFPRFLGVRNRS